MSALECRSCGALVVFVPSAKSGKRMILDVEPDPILGNVLVEDGKARVLGVKARIAARAQFPPPSLYVPHHATCPQAAEWHRRRT
jgi:hypothetical protein